MKKYMAIAVMTLILAAIALLLGKLNQKKSLPITLVVENDEGTESILPWYNENDDSFYYFVPSYADSERLRFDVRSSLEYVCKQDGKTVDDKCYDQFSEGDYTFCARNKEFLVKIRYSENIATLYIDTATGSMKSVISDKSRKEDISVRLFTKDGCVDFESSDLKLKGRGNSTWENRKKKPFNIISEEQISFMKMRESSKWILLANMYDSSNMRNKLAYDTARELGLKGTPEGEFVDLYFNGEYYGLYYLCQSVEKLETDSCGEGETVLKLDIAERVENANNSLPITILGHAFEVISPKEVSSKELREIEESVAFFLEEIENGEEGFLDFLDIESWVKKYMIDETFANFDSMVASSYIKISKNNGKPFIYVDAIWDFDNSLGNRRGYSGSTLNPCALFACAKKRGNASEDNIIWYSQLYKSDLFYRELVHEYLEEMELLLQKIIDIDIPSIDKEISSSARNNQIRWNYSVNYDDEVVYIKDYLSKRKAFLSSIWREERDYCVVSFERKKDTALFYYFFVEKGKSLSEDEYFTKLIDAVNLEWVNSNTGEELEISKPVFGDAKYISDETMQRSLKERLFEEETIICVFSLALLVAFIGILVFREKRIGG